MGILAKIFGLGFRKAAADKPPAASTAGLNQKIQSGKKSPKIPNIFYRHKSGKRISVAEYVSYKEAVHQRHRLDLKKILREKRTVQTPNLASEKSKGWNPLPGELVFAKGSAGKIESGWEVSQVEGKTVSLKRRDPADPGHDIKQTALLVELEKINERGKIDFAQAENWDDLSKLIRRNGIVQGSTAEYRPKRLKEMIEKVRQRKLSPRNITPANNLRQAVEKILKKEPKIEAPKIEEPRAEEPKPEIIDFSQAENWEDLFELIRRNGIVHGLTAEYRPKKLKEIIEKVRQRKLSPRNITPANNLRQAVEKLLKKEPKIEAPKIEEPKAEEPKPEIVAATAGENPALAGGSVPDSVVTSLEKNPFVLLVEREKERRRRSLEELMAQSKALGNELAATVSAKNNPNS